MKIETLLKEIDFHDLPLRELVIDFEKALLSLKIDVFDETRNDYNPIQLIFSNIHTLKIEGELDKISSDSEITDLNFLNIDTALTQYEFILLCDNSGSLSISFIAAELNKLSMV
jgi:hypothetical protein